MSSIVAPSVPRCPSRNPAPGRTVWWSAASPISRGCALPRRARTPPPLSLASARRSTGDAAQDHPIPRRSHRTVSCTGANTGVCTTVRSRQIKPMDERRPSPGVHSNQGYRVFLATRLRRRDAIREQEEQDLVTQGFPLSEVERMVRDGEIEDATTVAALGPLRLKGLI